MPNPEEIARICREAGYSNVTIEPPPLAYRGSTEPARSKVVVDIDGTRTLASIQHHEMLSGIIRVQAQIPQAAQILAVIPAPGEKHVALVERIKGSLIWEMEQNRPALADLAESLSSLVENLRNVRLVHADIRPWNLIFSHDESSVRCIDWGFSFFVGGRRYGSTDNHLCKRGHKHRNEEQIDQEDANRTIRVLRSPDRLETEWGHRNGQFTWRPAPWQ